MCLPTLTYQTFTDQQSAVAQARVNDAFQLEDTMSWFLPGKHGDHDLKFGLQFQYSQSENDTQDNSNGTFTFGQSNAAFDPNNPRTYPDRFSIRVPGAGGSLNKSQYYAGFLQDKWKLNNQLTLSLGLRYDLEVIPITETDNPLFASPGRLPGRQEQLPAASRLRLRHGRRARACCEAVTGGSTTKRISS